MGKILTREQAIARAAEPVTLALSIDAPWAWSIAHADKRVENRSWLPGAANEGRRIAIAATARAVSDDHVEELRGMVGRDFKVPDADEMETGAIIAMVRIVGLGYVDSKGHVVIGGRMLDVDMDRVLALAMNRDGAWCEKHPGNRLWILDDVRALVTPIPCKGMQRLWRLSPPIAKKLASAETVAETVG